MIRLLLLTAISLAAACAHEISLQQSTVDFLPDGSWHVAMSTDPLVLLAPEARAAGTDPRAAWAAMAADERHARLEKVRAIFADNIVVRFDGVPVATSVRLPSAEPVDDEIDRGCDGVAISGRIPPGAKSFSIATTKHIGPMVLILRRDGEDEPATLAVDSGGTSTPYRLDGGAEPGRFDAALRFLAMGFTHIVPEGLDHILFVLGLFLLGTRLKPLFVQITCFTVAHSLTLGLAWFGVVHVPSRVIEPLIALSIVAVAVENCWARDLSKWRPFVVFAFGLVHGLGFADILRSHDLPQLDFATALVSFNLGVEGGQLAVVASALLVTAWWRDRAWYRARITLPGSIAIAAVGAVWSVQRLLG